MLKYLKFAYLQLDNLCVQSHFYLDGLSELDFQGVTTLRFLEIEGKSFVYGRDIPFCKALLLPSSS